VIRRLFALLLFATLAPSGCVDRERVGRVFAAVRSEETRPDELPVARGGELPFHYPLSLYAKKIQGNVTLRLYIDSLGVVRPESTRVAESSGYAALDSAAVKGSEQLSYTPARKRGRPIGVSILLPVFFRHPEAAALPGDTVLHSREEAIGKREQRTP
jgi:TonB family protein